MMIGKGKGIFARILLSSLLAACTAAAFSPTSPFLLQQHHARRRSVLATSAYFGVRLVQRPSHRNVLLLAAKQDDANDNKETKSQNPFRFFLHPYESKIPNDELRDEIMKAESRTAAAQNRSQRVALYATIAALGVLAAFFNGFISELRSSNPPDEFVQGIIQDSISYSDNVLVEQDFVFDLQLAGFGWIESNFVTQFLFLNKIGGAVCLLGGAAAGLFAEAELDTRRINAEKIYEEMERRRLERERKTGGRSERRATSSNDPKQRKTKNKGLSGKERKRIEALTEVITAKSTRDNAPSDPAGAADEMTTAVKEESSPEKKDGGSGGSGNILDTIKGFYERADNMAASQALLLNKKLEDAGVLEKITDETGLNVIGKEKAAAISATTASSKSTTSDKDNDSQVQEAEAKKS